MRFAFTLLTVFLFLSSGSPAQGVTDGSRSQLNPYMYPFYHGVASGDPLTDRVIIWTRITLDPPVDPVQVNWQMATDTLFNTIVASGQVSTDSTLDYTVKVDVTGLQPNSWYYYRFLYDTVPSIVGRTRTLPTGTVSNLRFAVASCQDYQKGYYNAHKDLSKRNDIDAVLFLGDYTYEGGPDTIIPDRTHEPAKKTVQLFEYRMRQSQYHLDPDLQEAHRQFPWICVWDDHETANNSYTDGAKNHGVNDGPWYDRKVNGVETYEEWMPVRMPDPNDTFRIFRRFTFGDLLDLNMLDTRLYDRSKQAGGSVLAITDSILNDSTRTMVGPEQFNWLENNLDSSIATWQIIGQQVMMTPLVIPPGVFGPASIVNPDQWDGYPFEREKFYDFVTGHNIQNVVVLTGDIHTSWANDLPLTGYDSLNRENSAGVEFVCTSISSSNELPPLISESVILSLAQHVRFVDLHLHGYCVLDVRPGKVQSDYVYVSDVLTKNYTAYVGTSWCVDAGTHHLYSCNTPSAALNAYPAPAPGVLPGTGIKQLSDNVTTISIHPNPFISEVLIQYDTYKPEPITLQVQDANGRVVLTHNLGLSMQGTNYAEFDGSGLAKGFYVVTLKGRSGSVGKSVIKID